MPYYDPQGFALEMFKRRYALHEHETWEMACDRLAGAMSSAETGDDIVKFRKEFKELLRQNLFMPGGRIWYGAGRPKGQLLNCFVIPTEDSREGWGKTVSDMIVISGTGGGTGTNYSPIRPRDSIINGSGGKATGSTSLMEIVNSAGEVIKAGGGRRVALMMSLGLTHGDIEEFLDKKLDLKKLNNANVSVVFDDDPEEFFAKVKAEQDIELLFRGKVIGRVPAKKIWKKIVSNALKGGEPGLLNGYLANKMSNVWYFAKLICTNPCGEIWLPSYGCCDLGALVLPRFVVVGKTIMESIDWELLRSAVRSGTRFLDNVLTVNNFPLPEIKETCLNERRIGLGVMGLHDMLLMLGLRYNSDAGLELVDKVMSFIKNSYYEASIDFAVEKGSFPKFDPELYLKSGFIKTLKPSLRSKIRELGIRNAAGLTIAPTGTTAIVCDVTAAIEAAFGPAWLRRFYDGDELKSEVVVHPLFRRFVDEGRDTSHFQGVHDLSLRDHFEMQRVCQTHLDNACSKTINVLPGISEDEFSDLCMEFFPELKGLTVYPDQSRENQPITPLSLEDALRRMDASSHGALSADACHDGKCDL